MRDTHRTSASKQPSQFLIYIGLILLGLTLYGTANAKCTYTSKPYPYADNCVCYARTQVSGLPSSGLLYLRDKARYIK